MALQAVHLLLASPLAAQHQPIASQAALRFQAELQVPTSSQPPCILPSTASASGMQHVHVL